MTLAEESMGKPQRPEVEMPTPTSPAIDPTPQPKETTDVVDRSTLNMPNVRTDEPPSDDEPQSPAYCADCTPFEKVFSGLILANGFALVFLILAKIYATFKTCK